MSRAIFSKVASSQANMKGDNFKDGKGQLVIVQNLYKNMNDGPTFVARFAVIDAKSKGDLDPKTKQPVAPNAIGSRVGWPQKIEKHKSAAGNVKAYILNVLGYAESDVSHDDFVNTMEQCLSKEQPMRGMLVNFETYQQPTKSGPNAGQVNTYVKFIHVPPDAGNDAAAIAARRAELDKTDPVVGD